MKEGRKKEKRREGERRVRGEKARQGMKTTKYVYIIIVKYKSLFMHNNVYCYGNFEVKKFHLPKFHNKPTKDDVIKKL